MDDGREWTLNILYRLAYGATRNRIDIQRHDSAWGRVPSEDIARELQIDPNDVEALDAVRRGVEDAEAGRQPVW